LIFRYSYKSYFTASSG